MFKFFIVLCFPAFSLLLFGNEKISLQDDRFVVNNTLSFLNRTTHRFSVFGDNLQEIKIVEIIDDKNNLIENKIIYKSRKTITLSVNLPKKTLCFNKLRIKKIVYQIGKKCFLYTNKKIISSANKQLEILHLDEVHYSFFEILPTKIKNLKILLSDKNNNGLYLILKNKSVSRSDDFEKIFYSGKSLIFNRNTMKVENLPLNWSYKKLELEVNTVNSFVFPYFSLNYPCYGAKISDSFVAKYPNLYNSKNPNNFNSTVTEFMIYSEDNNFIYNYRIGLMSYSNCIK